jgi:PPOX class probable F420-dependent enzyme
MELADALAFARPRRDGILITLKSDGRPQSSNISYAVGDDDRILISITSDRAKYANLRRDPRASLHVNADNFWSYVVIEADAELSPVATEPDDPTVDALVEYYRALRGEHPDWDDYRRAMIEDRRLVLTLVPTYAYGMVRT